LTFAFLERENRKSQGMYLGLLGDYDDKNGTKESNVEMANRDSEDD
jgi:hypothetical protein